MADRRASGENSVQIAPKGDSLHNAITIVRHLRLRVLDIRSGMPLGGLRVEGIEIDDQSVYVSQDGLHPEDDPTWDIGEQPRIPTGKHGGPASGTWKAARVKALERLGYEMGEGGDKSALEAFKEDWDGELSKVHGGAGAESKASLAIWTKRLIAENNRRFNCAAQTCLTALGFNCMAECGTWGKESVSAYEKWQRQCRRRRKDKLARFVSPSDAQELLEQRLGIWTDSGGWIDVQIPIRAFLDGFQLKIRFLEVATMKRVGVLGQAHADDEPTGFDLEWLRPPERAKIKDWQTDSNWRWHVRAPGDTRATSALPELSVEQIYSIPAGRAEGTFESLAKTDDGREAGLAESADGKAAYLELYGMKWAQPVYDAIEDPPMSGHTNESVLLQDPLHRNRHMHLCTVYFDLGGTEVHGGIGYGRAEYALEPRWRGNGRISPLSGLLRLRHLGYGVGTPVPRSSDPLPLETEPMPTEPTSSEFPWDQPLLSNHELVALYDGERLRSNDGERPGENSCMYWIRRYQLVYDLDPSGVLDRRTLSSLEAELGRSEIFADKKDGHRGLDISVCSGNQHTNGAEWGDPVFAVRGGEVSSLSNWNGKSTQSVGNTVTIKWAGGGRKVLGYLHLDCIFVKNRDRVRAGQVLGCGGRTGNFGDLNKEGRYVTVSQWPSHVHLNVGIHEDGVTTLLDLEPDEANRCCIPTSQTALLFPCRCEVPTGEKLDDARGLYPIGCRFDRKRVVGNCWAVFNLQCPHIPAKGSVTELAKSGGKELCKEKLRIQAQLMYLFERHGSPYQSPGPIDGDPGRKTYRALQVVRGRTGLPAPAKPGTIEQAVMDELDKLAPIRIAPEWCNGGSKSGSSELSGSGSGEAQ